MRSTPPNVYFFRSTIFARSTVSWLKPFCVLDLFDFKFVWTDLRDWLSPSCSLLPCSRVTPPRLGIFLCSSFLFVSDCSNGVGYWFGAKLPSQDHLDSILNRPSFSVKSPYRHVAIPPYPQEPSGFRHMEVYDSSFSLLAQRTSK